MSADRSPDNSSDPALRQSDAALRERALLLGKAVRAFQPGQVLEMLRNGTPADVTDPETGKPMLFAVMDLNTGLDEDAPQLGMCCAIFVNFFSTGKADPNMRDAQGTSALRYALGLENHFLVAVLVAMKADVNERYADTGDTPLHDAVRQALAGTGIRALNALLTHGGDAAVPNNQGFCAYDLVDQAATGQNPHAAARVADIRAMLAESAPVQKLLAERTQARYEQLREQAQRRPHLKPAPRKP